MSIDHKECGSVIKLKLIVSSASDPWSSESSGSFVTLQLIPGQSVLDWGEPLEPGPDSEEFLRPPVEPTPADKKVGVVQAFIVRLKKILSVNQLSVHPLFFILGYLKDCQVFLETLELSVRDRR